MSLWRIFFGLVLLFETAGSNLVGWTKQVYIDPPRFTFNFMDFDWLQPLPGDGMYYYFWVMAVLAICITVGWRYRIAMSLFTIGWAGLYFMHKTSYNNHHYLMLLLCLMMVFTPGHSNLSYDAKQGRVQRRDHLPALYRWSYIVLLLIVYTYASVAKWYPDWTSGRVTELMFSHKSDIPVIGIIYTWPITSVLVAWGGILFDLLVIPFLLWKRTRVVTFWIAVVFHMFNSITFQIGTFPYMMIASMALFFPAPKVRKFFRQPEAKPDANYALPGQNFQRLATSIFVLFMTIQVLLPLRHHLIEGSVYWTEEGHKLSWRMMLRSKQGNIHFRIIDAQGKLISHSVREDLTPSQYRNMATHPDQIWQYCQFLKKTYGNDIEIYVLSWVSLNGRKFQQLIDPKVDMAKAQWHRYKHESWILPIDWSLQ